jgi:hypothetical protein
MASATKKMHFLRAGEYVQLACGRPADSGVQFMNGNRPMAHPSGRLLTRSERRGVFNRMVTCAPCRRQGQLDR